MLTRRYSAWALPLLMLAALVGLAVFFHHAPPAAAQGQEPRPVRNLEAQPGDTQIKVTWEANSSGGTPTGYDVQYTSSTNPSGVGNNPANKWVRWTHSGTTTTATITGLTNGTEHRVRVRATNADGNSNWQSVRATPNPTITLTSSDTDGVVAEGDSAITLTATLSQNASSTVTVAVARVSADSTAAAGDIGSIASISIASGSNTGTTSLTIVDDDVDEDDGETLKLRATATGHIAGDLELTINDNDTSELVVSATALTVEVGEDTTYTVKLNSKPTHNVIIQPAAGGQERKISISPETRTFTPSNWDTAQTFTVRGIAKTPPKVTVLIYTSSRDSKYSSLSGSKQVTVTVNPSTKTYEITSAVTVTEADSAEAELTVTLGRTVTEAAGHELSVAYSYAGSDATSADTGTTPTSVTVAQNATTATLTIPITNDAWVEDQETFTATISSSTSGWHAKSTGKNVATVTITDDEAPAAAIAFHGTNSGATAVYTADVNESTATLNVPVTVNHLPQANTDFAISIETGTRPATEGASADYSIATKKVTFGPTSNKTRNLTVTIKNNTLVEFDETISLKIDDSSGNLGTHYTRNTNSRKATVTIQDDDQRAAKIAFGTATRTTKYTASPLENVSDNTFNVPIAIDHLPAASTTFTVTVLGTGTATEYDSNNPTDPYDFRINPKTVTFGSTGNKSRNLAITINNDTWVEDDQTIELMLLAADGTPDDLGDFYDRDTNSSKATITIQDDEWDNAKVAFNANAAATAKFTATPDEDLSTGKLSVPITISALPETDSEFTVSVLAASTATEGTDYSIAGKTFKFSTMDDTATTDVDETALSRNLEITIDNDMLVELDQTIELEISSGTGFFSKYVRHAQGKLATITIEDDERPEANIEIGGTDTTTTYVVVPGPPGNPPSRRAVTVVGSRTGAEGDGTLTVPITINHLPESDVTFNVEVTGGKARQTADNSNPTGNPKDYEFVSKQVTFTSTGEKSMNLTINIEDDNVDEDDEGIELRIVAAGTPRNDLSDHYRRDADDSQATLIITDNDAVQSIKATFSVAANEDGLYHLFEGNPTTMTVATDIPVGPGGWRVTIERDPTSEQSYLVDLAGICRARGNHSIFACTNDFTLPAPFTIQEGQKEATLNLVIRQDNRVENFAERLHLRVVAQGRGRLRSEVYKLRLNDNTKGINLSPSTLNLVPGETATYTVELRGGAPTSDVTVTPDSSDTDKATVSSALSFTTSDNTASDYYTNSQEVTVTAVAAGTATISHVAASDDATYNLASSGLGSVKVTVEAAENTYQITPSATAAEGESVELTVTLGALAPTGDLTINVDRSRTGVTTTADDRTADPASDLSSPASSVAVSATKRRATLTETFADDDLVEGDEHYYVVISTTTNGWSNAKTHANCDQDAACAKVTITDPDTENAQIAFGNAAGSTTRYEASVSEGGGTLTVPVTINALPKEPTTFNIGTSSTGTGLATEGTDYSIATKSVTFASDSTDTALTKNVTVTITEDTDPEGDETIVLLIAAADDTVNDLGDYYQRNTNSSQATLTITDNDGAVEVSNTAVGLREETTATYTIRLYGAVPTSNVTVTPTSDTPDKATVSGPLIFTPGNYQQTQTVTVTGVALGDATISHSVSSSDPSYPSTLTVSSVAVKVASGVLAELTVSPNPVREGRPLTVTIRLSEALDTEETIPITLTAGATDPAETGDYDTLANIRIRQRSTTGTGRIATHRDVDLDDETFTVALVLPASLSPGSSISELVTIDDPDVAIEAVVPTIRAGNGRLRASWPRPTGTTIDGYDVHYTAADEQTVANDAPVSTDAEPDPTTAWVNANHSGTSRSIIIPDLENDTEYRVRVRAFNSLEKGPWGHATGTPAANARINPPGGGGGGGGLVGLTLSGSASVDYPENDTAIVGAYRLSGTGAAFATWSLEGDDAADFRLVGSGDTRTLNFVSPPDYETPADADADNVYEVTIKATRATSTDTLAVTVTVSDEDENEPAPVLDDAGTLTLSSALPGVGMELTATLTDPNGAVSSVTWQWERSSGGGTYADIAGATSASYTPVAEDVGYHLRVTVTYTDSLGVLKSATATTQSAVAADADDPLLVRYDANNNGWIERPEVIAAINDYFDGGANAPTREDVIAVINLYFDGPPL